MNPGYHRDKVDFILNIFKELTVCDHLESKIIHISLDPIGIIQGTIGILESRIGIESKLTKGKGGIKVLHEGLKSGRGLPHEKISPLGFFEIIDNKMQKSIKQPNHFSTNHIFSLMNIFSRRYTRHKPQIVYDYL